MGQETHVRQSVIIRQTHYKCKSELPYQYAQIDKWDIQKNISVVVLLGS